MEKTHQELLKESYKKWEREEDLVLFYSHPDVKIESHVSDASRLLGHKRTIK